MSLHIVPPLTFFFCIMNYLHLYSYNMHGFANGHDFLTELKTKSNIICVQESWVRAFETNIFDEVTTFPFQHISHSGMHELDYSLGSPYGGLSIIYDSSSVKLAQDYGISINNRVMCTMFSVNNQLLLLFNVYLPCLCDTVDYINDVNIICSFMESVVFSNAGKQFYMII